jgi:N-hydroxyarylamine O-acetyltransferase
MGSWPYNEVMVDVHAYLARIGYPGPTELSGQTLRSLHRAHMLAVPFENLDIHLGRPIVCDESCFLRKIIEQRRGGFCYELNGAFAALLRALGFRVTLLSARVAHANGSYGPDFDHLTLRVDVPSKADESTWLADVGFGDSFVEPLLLEPGCEQPQIGRVYRLRNSEGAFHMEVKAADRPDAERPSSEDWKKQYCFTLEPRRLEEFEAMCAYQQTSPESHFTQQRICSRATPEGRITLSELKLIETRNGQREERLLSGEVEWRAELRRLFAIDLPDVMAREPVRAR